MNGWCVSWKLGLCGFGYEGGLFPEVRLGVLRVVIVRGYLKDIAGEMRSYKIALRTAAIALGLSADALLP